MPQLLRSVSEPSIGLSVGTGVTNISGVTRSSHMNIAQANFVMEQQRGRFLWQGRFRPVVLTIVNAPWTKTWQYIVLLTVVYAYLVNFLLLFYIPLGSVWSVFDTSLYFTSLVFTCDVIIHLLHAQWPLVRFHLRPYRRSCLALSLDIVSLFPYCLAFSGYPNLIALVYFGRWVCICRIYRLFVFCHEVNDSMHKSRKLLYIIEHVVITALIMHAGTCIWYGTHYQLPYHNRWGQVGYPKHVGAEQLRFDAYLTCCYYSICRIFGVLFGDSFPVKNSEKWITSALMVVGFIMMRYRFIGAVAWDLVVENSRRLNFVDQYHHMLRYLHFHHASLWLVQQASRYQQQLWRMKEGVLASAHLQRLPLPLQMELIFDINVAHFHNTLLFRDTGESFMRQISLLMKHEVFLEGQQIWSQGVVKNGMICIKRGVVEILSDEDDESPMIAFKEGTVLGELSLFYSIPAKVTVQAASYVELQLLQRTDFMYAMKEQSSMMQMIREKIETRLKSSVKRQTAIDEYDLGDSRLIRTRYRPMKVLKDRLCGRQDEDSSFSDDSHLYYKDKDNTRKPKFTAEYLELYKVSNNVTTIKSPRICLRARFPWILEPDTEFTHIFDVAHFIMVIYVCLVYPYEAIVSDVRSEWNQALSTVVMAGFYLHLYMELTTAYVDKNTKKQTVREIAEVKMASLGFYLDIISVFPVYIFTDTLDPHGENAWGQVALMCPILQFWHVFHYMYKWERSFYSNPKFVCVLKYTIVFVVLSYWAGCFLYLYSCPRRLCQENSWMLQLTYWETKVVVATIAKHEQAIVTSLSLGAAVVTGSGISGVSPGYNDLPLIIILVLLGSYLVCFYTAKLCSIYMLCNNRTQKFKESMRELFYFLSVNHVSSKIKSRVKKFFCVQWYYNSAVSTGELFKDMSAHIQQEVLSIEMIDTLLCCPLFQDCSRDFLQTVASKTRSLVLPDNEIVQHAADIGRYMYILQKGHCNLLNHYGKVICSVGPGHRFGAMEMLYGLPKVHTVLTTTNCILLHIEYSALVQCLSTFPDVAGPINEVLNDEEVALLAYCFEDAKPMTGRFDVKINRIAQELKESFVVLNGPYEKRQYMMAFEKLGLMKWVKYIVIPGCVTPHGIFLKVWCAFRCILAIYYIMRVPYDIATKSHQYGDACLWVDSLLYLDIVVMAYVAYYDERSLLVTHPLYTMVHYMRHAFLFDIISVFPFEQLLRIVNDSTNMDLYRINRLLMVSRITGAFQYWESDIMNSNESAVLLKFLPLALTIVNFATSIIFVNSCTPFISPDNPGYIQVNCIKDLIMNGQTYVNRSAVMEYVFTFAWVFQLFVGCGCTPTTLSSSVDMKMVIALQLIGCIYFAFMFAYVASTRSAASHALLYHTEQTKDLANFLYQENVDPALTAKTLRYFEYVWKRTNGSNPQKICRRLNSALMEDTLVFMYEKTLREVPLFGNVERSFIRVITQHLTEMYFLKGETVIQCRDIQPYIFIIYRGKVDVMSSYNEMVTCMGPGGMFGNFTGQPISCSDVSIYASRSLDLLVIPSQTFFNLVKYYPKIQEPLNKAFEMSKDYILPITMDIATDDASSEEDDDANRMSADSTYDSRDGSSAYDDYAVGQISTRSSHSSISHTKSGTSVQTYQSQMYSPYNLLRPGSVMFQSFGYLTCFMATANYVLVLYDLVTVNQCYVIFWLQAVFDIYFYIKTYQSMHQGYLSKRGEIIMTSSKCRQRYFRHQVRVWTDLLANLPLELFGLCFQQDVRVMHYFRANKMLRIKYLLEFYRKTAAELTNNLTTLQTAMSFFVATILLHTFTCMWLLLLSATKPFCVIRTLKTHLLNEQPQQIEWDYSTSLYLMTGQLTGAGGDEYLIQDLAPIALLSICLICGKMLASIVVATAIQISYSTRHALTIYERETTELIDVLKNQGLSNYQLQKFWTYVTQLWVTERGRQLPALLAQTPYVRRCDLMSAMFGHHLRSCYIFTDTGEPFLRQLTVALEYTIFFPGNYIVVAGDSDSRIYWVDSGTVSVVSVRSDLTETTHELLSPGDVFGITQGLTRAKPHCFSYRANTKVSILTLSLDSWIHILPYFPEANKIITERAELLFARI